MDKIRCVTLSGHEIQGFEKSKDLLELGGDELFVVDLDGLNSGTYNFKLYYDISKFFEITVMSFPKRAADLVDSIVSGASKVVVSSNLEEKKITDFLSITDELVMNYGNMGGCRFFSERGGRYFLSNRLVDLPFEKVYLYGSVVDSKGYTVIEGFPEFIYSD